MSLHPNEISTDALLEQAGWLTALARRLVRDPAEADDVAQETMLAAMSSGEPAPRRWLAHVARNIARARARSQSARTQRESSRGSPPPAPSSSDLAEKLEAQRLLVEAVRDLDEPYRATILLHYWEHKTSAEIAAMQGVPAGTVRWRLKQAVDELRTRLDVRHGDRRAWSVLLVPLVKTAGVPTMASTTVFTGVLGMKLHTLIAAFLLVLLGAGAWTLIHGMQSGSTRSTSISATSDELAKVRPPTSNAAVLDPAAASPAQRSSATVPSFHVNQEGSIAHVEARVVDELHVPIAGATVTFSHAKSASASDASGNLIAEADLDREEMVSESFEFTALDRATRSVSANLERSQTTYLGDVVLQPGGAVSGVVVDEAGKPAARASVGLYHDTRSFPEQMFGRPRVNMDVPRTSIAPDGSFHLEGMPVGSQQLVAKRASASVWSALLHDSDGSFSGIFEVRWKTETTGIRIILPSAKPDRRVSAIVLDPDELPVPHISYSIQTTTQSGTGSVGSQTDSKGRFTGAAGSEGTAEVYARDDLARWEDTPHILLHDGDNEVTLRFMTARKMLEISVTDEKSAPLERWTGTLRSPNDDGAIMKIPHETHAGGVARVGLPKVPFMLVIEARSLERVRLGPFEPAMLGPTLAVVLHTQPGIRGRVVDASGPVARARVQLFREAHTWIETDGFPSSFEPTPRDSVLTGEDGTFQLMPRENGRFVVRAEKAGAAPTEASGLSVDVDRGIRGVNLMLSAGGAIEGRVLENPGVDPTGSIVAISRGDPFSTTQRVGPDGTFSFQNLIPGRWMVTSTTKELRTGHDSTTTHAGLRLQPLSNCEVLEGQTTRFDIDRREANLGCVLLGKLDFNGSSNFTWTAQFAGGDSSGARPARLDMWGHQFRLATTSPGATNILLMATSGDLEGTTLTAPVVLKVGETQWQLSAEQATLELHGDGSRTDPDIPLVLVTPCGDGSTFLRPLVAKGDASLEVPAGKGRVLWLDESVRREEDPRTWTGGVEITLAPRATVRIARP